MVMSLGGRWQGWNGSKMGKIMGVCLKIGNTPKPNGFADHEIPIEWLFHWEYTLFSDKIMWVLLKNDDGEVGLRYSQLSMIW